MKQRFFVGLLVAAALGFVFVDARLRIGAFNCQVLGQTKMSKQYVVDIVVQIIRRYDILFVQEIRDISNTVPFQLLNAVNKDSNVTYNVTVSERLGRTSSKEAYAYYYRSGLDSGIRLMDAYVFNDTTDIFERPPYAAKFSLTDVSVMNELILIGIHAKPLSPATLNEILALQDVYADAVQRWGNENSIVFGDMNADGSYLPKYQREQLTPMYTFFDWLIADKTRTNLGTTAYTYDRILVAGSALKSAVVPGSGKPYYYDEILGFDLNTARNVSDHYPVEFELKDRNVRLVDLLAAKDHQTTEH